MEYKLHNTLKGAVCIIISAFFFALMGLFVQLAGDISPIQKSFFRNAVAAVIAVIVLIKNRESFRPREGSIVPLLLRSIFGTIGIICNFYALDHLILSDALMLNKLSPFFAVIFSFFVMKEKIKPFQLVMVFLAFFGSLFIIKPTMDLINIASIAGLIGGLCAGFAYAMVRKLTQGGERGTYVVFFFSTFSCLSVLPYLIFSFESMTAIQLIYLILAGITAALGQFTITAAYSFAPASEISVYDYTQVIFSTIMSFLVFSVTPDIYSVTGYIIICLASILTFIKNRH